MDCGMSNCFIPSLDKFNGYEAVFAFFKLRNSMEMTAPKYGIDVTGLREGGY